MNVQNSVKLVDSKRFNETYLRTKRLNDDFLFL